MRGGGVVLVNISSYRDQYDVENKVHLDFQTERLQHLRFSTPIKNTYKRFFLIFTKLKLDCFALHLFVQIRFFSKYYIQL